MSEKEKQYKEGAIILARQLCRDAVWNNDTCNWLSTFHESGDSRQFYTRSCGPYFYNGTAGISFFLLKSSTDSGDSIITNTAEGALKQMLDSKLNEDIGFYTGITGIAFVLSEAGDRLNKGEYHEAAKKYLTQIRQTGYHGASLDVAEGIAGALPALIKLEKRYENKLLADYITVLADYLLAQKNEYEFGWSWQTIDGSSKNLTGFGHGASGIANAFICMYEYTRNEKYLSAAEKAFAYEDFYFQPDQQNWPDFRKGYSKPDKNVCSVAWCHGAPGIGLARLKAARIFKKQQHMEAAMKAALTTLRYNNVSSSGNFSLCHGLAGNSLFLHQAAIHSDNQNFSAAVQQVADSITEQFILKKIPLPGGVGNNAETPGFMTGKAGIGYFLLKLAKSDELLPSMCM